MLSIGKKDIQEMIDDGKEIEVNSPAADFVLVVGW